MALQPMVALAALGQTLAQSHPELPLHVIVSKPPEWAQTDVLWETTTFRHAYSPCRCENVLRYEHVSKGQSENRTCKRCLAAASCTAEAAAASAASAAAAAAVVAAAASAAARSAAAFASTSLRAAEAASASLRCSSPCCAAAVLLNRASFCCIRSWTPSLHACMRMAVGSCHHQCCEDAFGDLNRAVVLQGCSSVLVPVIPRLCCIDNASQVWSPHRVNRLRPALQDDYSLRHSQ